MKKGWSVKKLGDVTESISTGPFGTMLHKSDYVVDGIPLVNPVNIVDGRIVPSEKMMISNETRKRLSNYVLRTGDVVVGRRGELGRCAIVSDVEAGWLTDKGFGREQLAEMQKLIDAEKSDLFDVLAHVAYALSPLSREERAAMAKLQIKTHFNDKKQAFLDFVLAHYVNVGVEELDQEKLTPLLNLRYDSISDGISDLGGRPDEIGKVFAGFQRYLYEKVVE